MKKYRELLDLNIITQEEFDKIKKELLNIKKILLIKKYFIKRIYTYKDKK